MTRFARETLKLRIVNYYSNVENNDNPMSSILQDLEHFLTWIYIEDLTCELGKKFFSKIKQDIHARSYK